MLPLPCVIFAGGKSRRMGEDKALLPFGGFNTLTEFQLHKLSPHFKEVYISCKTRSKFNFDANFIEDNPHYHDSSPLIALLSIFEQLPDEQIAILSVDTPYFGAQHFQKLLQEDNKQASIIVSKSSSGSEPLCAIYKKKSLSTIRRLLSEKKYKMRALFENVSTQYVNFEEDEIFTNLNFQEDYQKALQRNRDG
jgi:molybdopterin-guanine dinucleotide biosynthesis protein A